MPGNHAADQESSRHQAGGDDPEVSRLVDHRTAMPILFNRHGRDRHNEYHERGHSNVRPTKPASASTAAVLVAGRLVAELLLIHAPVSLARDRACEASPVLGHHQLGLLFAKETEHDRAGHRVKLAGGGRHSPRARLYEPPERPCADASWARGDRIMLDAATCSVAGANLHSWAKGGIRGDRLGLRSRLRPPRRLSLGPRTDRRHHRAESPRAGQDGPDPHGLSPATRQATRTAALGRVRLRDGPALSR